MVVYYLIEFLIVCSSALLLARIAPRLGLIAHPGEHRVHQTPTPMVGGIAIFLGLLFAAVVISDELLSLLPAMSLIFIVGVFDDRLNLASWLRFVCQALAIYLMVYCTGVELTSLGEIWPGSKVELGQWSLALTIFAGIGVINAINMSDGLDGLAGTMVVATLLAVVWVSDSVSFAGVATIVAVSAFLAFNLRVLRPRAKIFLGDAGSTLLGLLLAYFLIKSSQLPHADIAPVTALWLMALPLFDAVAVLLIRPLRGGSPFAADRIHYHHLIQGRGLRVNQTLLVALAIHGLLITAGFILGASATPEYVQLAVFLACFALYSVYLWQAVKNKPDLER